MYYGFGVSALFKIIIDTCSIILSAVLKEVQKIHKFFKTQTKCGKSVFIHILVSNVIPIV